MTSAEFRVHGMSCGHCELSVREEVEKVAGIEGIDVSAQTGLLVVTSVSEIDTDAVVAAVDEAGYRAVAA